jgi:hypothetical protein
MNEISVCSNIYNAAMESSQPSALVGPIPLPPVQLGSFITGNEEQPFARLPVSRGGKRAGSAAGGAVSSQKGKRAASVSRLTLSLEGGLLELYDEFLTLTPGKKDALLFFRDLPGKLATLGEGVGHGSQLKKDSFLWNAWRYAWSAALSKSFAMPHSWISCNNQVIIATVHRKGEKTRPTVAIPAMARYMLQSLSYHRFQIVGWPHTLRLPNSAAMADAISWKAQISMKELIKSWYSYRLLSAIYVGCAGSSPSSPALRLQFVRAPQHSRLLSY